MYRAGMPLQLTNALLPSFSRMMQREAWPNPQAGATRKIPRITDIRAMQCALIFAS
jgi:hypothetical protein